ncbi:MAG: RHS domain-containing protein, partial [Streptococcaceae bacterium]|nr:RHS domain-containing protein [Streptococcaceae bacterium]
KSAKAPDKVISDAEARYWASLDAESARRAKELGISQNNGSDNSDPKLCNIYYFHTDQVGLPEELSNSRGQLVWKASYKTWGSTVAESWDITDLKGDRVFESERGDIPTGEQRQQNLRFQGQYLDRETGLHYNTFRYYDPDIGRFISPDPIGLVGGLNLSIYSPNPISWIDPLGWDTDPSLPGNIIASDGNTRIVHNYGDLLKEHADPIHYHVEQGGRTIAKVKTDGTVIDGRLNPKAKGLLKDPAVLRKMRSATRRIANYIRKVGKGMVGGRPFQLGNRGMGGKGCQPR